MMPQGGFVGAWLFVVLSVGCALITGSGLPLGVSDIWFTNAETGPGFQVYPGRAPQQLLPAVRIFDRARDSKVKLVVLFNSGDPHEIRVTRIMPTGTQYSFNWSVPRSTQARTQRWESRDWPLDASWMPGQYRVDLTIDGVPAGSYTFEVK